MAYITLGKSGNSKSFFTLNGDDVPMNSIRADYSVPGTVMFIYVGVGNNFSGPALARVAYSNVIDADTGVTFPDMSTLVTYIETNCFSSTSGGGGGSGTVTSVGLTAPTGFTVTGSPVTAAGTIALTLDSQTQGLFLASPAGSAGVPSFRAIAVTDIPSGASGFFKDGGNAFGHTAVLGTTDNNNVIILRNNTTVGTFTATTFQATSNIMSGGGSVIGWNGRSQMTSGADGNILLTNNAGTNFGSLGFGGTATTNVALDGTSGSNELRVINGNNTAFQSVRALNGFFTTTVQSPTLQAFGGASNGQITWGAAASTTLSRNLPDAVPVFTIQNSSVSSTGNLLSVFSADGTNRFQIAFNGNILGTAANSFGIGNLNSASGSNAFGLTMPSGGATMSRNINDAGPTLIMLKNQGTGLIQDWRFGATLGTSVASIDISGNMTMNNLTAGAGAFSNIVAVAGAGTAANQSLRVAGTSTNTSATGFGANISTNFTVSSGTGGFAGLAYIGVINQTISTAPTRGCYVNPTIIAAADFRAFEATTGRSIFMSVEAAIVTKTVNYTLTANDYTVKFDATSGALIAQLPTAAGNTRIYHIIKVDVGVNTISLTPNGSETINGSNTPILLITQWQYYTIQSDNANWIVIGHN